MKNIDFLTEDIKKKLPQFLESAQYNEDGADWEYSLFSSLTEYINTNIEDKKFDASSEEVKNYISILNDMVESKNETLQSVAYTEGVEVINNSENFRCIIREFLKNHESEYHNFATFYNINTGVN